MTKPFPFLVLTAILALAPAAQAKDQKPVDPNKKVCRSDIPTGSMMSKRTCHTNAEWAQIDAANAANASNAGEALTRSLGTQQ